MSVALIMTPSATGADKRSFSFILIGRLVGWLVGRSVGQSVGRLVGRLIGLWVCGCMICEQRETRR